MIHANTKIFFLILTVPHYSDLIHYIDEADNICKYCPDGYRLKIRACLFNFFFELNAHFYTHTDMSAHLSDDKMDKLKLVLNYIEKNFARAISIEEPMRTTRSCPREADMLPSRI